MKRFFAILAFVLAGFAATAQNESLGCIDRDMRVQSEGLKASFVKQGLTVYRDAMISMESQTPTPIGIQMVKGRMYQLIFVGNTRSSEVAMEIFDGNDKKIADKKTAKGGNNYVAFTFIPEKTDLYLIVLTQKFKGKTTCGSFTLLHEDPKQGKDAPANTVPAKK